MRPFHPGFRYFYAFSRISDLLPFIEECLSFDLESD